jgi:hypothetical protein
MCEKKICDDGIYWEGLLKKPRKRGRPPKVKKPTKEDGRFKDSSDLSQRHQNRAIECPLCKCLTHLKCLEIPLLSITDSPRYYNLTTEEKLKLINSNSKEEMLQYVCRCCMESRTIETFYAFMDPPSENTDSLKPEAFATKESYFNEKRKKENMYLVKLKNTAYYHCIWIDYDTAQEFSARKLTNFCKKMKEMSSSNNKKQQQMQMVVSKQKSSEENNAKNDTQKSKDSTPFLIFSTSFMECDRILGIKPYDGQIIKYFVKWKGLDYDSCTWEYCNFIKTLAPKAVKTYHNIMKFRNKL